ncbi:MAG: CTP synthase [Candidatus Marsarchaeota archaeon]|jgi:CTP synthase|nr:CTP synthase [Candidatus Marsarchaeota archaeon]MCL5418845.1 CTP synthase [Candidatus Marsarchaeota archaeon]
MQTKYVVVLGSLLSGLGKGILTASMGKILSFYGHKVLPVKFDGYLNYDCGTMNPFRHGEVFVLDDKSEVDMDFGTYERFLNIEMDSMSSITGGKLFSDIIAKERKGDFLGTDVQIVPHLTSYILEKINAIAKAKQPEIMLIEVGGTVGDIENSYFIEAMRQLSNTEKVVFVTITYVPELESVGEQKTKPTQIALRQLMQVGVMPDFIVSRSSKPLSENAKSKLALYSSLPESNIIDDHDSDNIYKLPLHLMEQGFGKMLAEKLDVSSTPDKKAIRDWLSTVDGKRNRRVRISIVGKYVALKDAYASLKEAFSHAGMANHANVELKWVESENLENKKASDIAAALKDSDGILVPGGFGKRGIEGMINAIEYARNNKIPFLGICLGMQLMAVEYARNVCMLKGANSTEFDKSARYKIIDLMEDQKHIKYKGGTMRLGSWPLKIKKGTLTYEAYGKQLVNERHRHRFEFNNRYRAIMEKRGLVISGTTPDNMLVENIEWKGSFGIGTQAHPELKSRPQSPAPLFVSFIGSAIKYGGIRH